VVQKLSGAHLLIQLKQGLAIRSYFSCDLQELMETMTYQEIKGNGDFDNLISFLKSFRHAIVFFILSQPEEQRQQLDDPNSLFHRVQRLVQAVTHSDANKITRIFLLSSAEGAVSNLKSFVNAYYATENKKRMYFEKQHQKYFLPKPRHIPATSRPAATKYVADAFWLWADRFELPEGEADVIMSLLGSMQAIGTADKKVLRSVPIDSRSKKYLLQFFGSMSEDEVSQYDAQQEILLTGLSASEYPLNDCKFSSPQTSKMMTNNSLVYSQTTAHRSPTIGHNYYLQQQDNVPSMTVAVERQNPLGPSYNYLSFHAPVAPPPHTHFYQQQQQHRKTNYGHQQKQISYPSPMQQHYRSGHQEKRQASATSSTRSGGIAALQHQRYPIS
jgi:hypothetical protein